MRLALHCGGFFSNEQVLCQNTIEVSLQVLSDNPGGPGAWAGLLKRAGWFVTTVTPPGQGEITFDVLCPACAPKVLPAELLAALRRVA